MATTFPPLKSGISWTNSTTDNTGAAMQSGEVLQSTTLGIRPDGSPVLKYPTMVVVPAPATTETVAALTAALGAALPPGNYWLNASQTDVVSATGQTAISEWMSVEVPFSIPPQPVAPAAPTALSVG